MFISSNTIIINVLYCRYQKLSTTCKLYVDNLILIGAASFAILAPMRRGKQKELLAALRSARLKSGMTQQALADKVGCKQSAVSMLECGRADALSDASLKKIADALGIDVTPYITDESESALLTGGSTALSCARLCFCPNFSCPSNMPYTVCGTILFMPSGICGAGKRCVCCGEILMWECPHCGAPVSFPGGCCGTCGGTLIEFPDGYDPDPETWAQRRVSEIEAFMRRCRMKM